MADIRDVLRHLVKHAPDLYQEGREEFLDAIDRVFTFGPGAIGENAPAQAPAPQPQTPAQAAPAVQAAPVPAPAPAQPQQPS